MECSDLKENFETGLFESENGRRFVRCEFNPEEPRWIEVTGESWSVSYAGQNHVLDWSTLGLPAELKDSLKRIVLDRLKSNAPSHLSATRFTLVEWAHAASAAKVDLTEGLGTISASVWLSIWEQMSQSTRSRVRSLYTELADNGLSGANFSIAKEMGRWKARNDTTTLRYVMEWDADSGSFTTSEWELIRGMLNREYPKENDTDFASRIFGRILNESLKRPIQILAMKRDALWIAPSGREFFLRIPKAKGQTGESSGLWQITDALAMAIQSYSKRPQIRSLQERFDRLIVFPSTNGKDTAWMAHEQVPVATAKSLLQQWALRQGMISPRTNREINLTPYRIRHTGATAMALQGTPRDDIQEVLEHDSPYSADAYIQAVGSDLMPALERATDRGIGKVFSELRNSYFFKGELIDKVERRPILIPIVDKSITLPAVVGACGKDGACTKHPFWACYNGCPHFLAWREAPHQKSLDYVESELKRWSDAEGGKERSKLGKDFDRVGAAIHEVIRQIDQSVADEVTR
jgi:integrase